MSLPLTLQRYIINECWKDRFIPRQWKYSMSLVCWQWFNHISTRLIVDVPVTLITGGVRNPNDEDYLIDVTNEDKLSIDIKNSLDHMFNTRFNLLSHSRVIELHVFPLKVNDIRTSLFHLDLTEFLRLLSNGEQWVIKIIFVNRPVKMSLFLRLEMEAMLRKIVGHPNTTIEFSGDCDLNSYIVDQIMAARKVTRVNFRVVGSEPEYNEKRLVHSLVGHCHTLRTLPQVDLTEYWIHMTPKLNRFTQLTSMMISSDYEEIIGQLARHCPHFETLGINYTSSYERKQKGWECLCKLKISKLKLFLMSSDLVTQFMQKIDQVSSLSLSAYFDAHPFTLNLGRNLRRLSIPLNLVKYINKDPEYCGANLTSLKVYGDNMDGDHYDDLSTFLENNARSQGVSDAGGPRLNHLSYWYDTKANTEMLNFYCRAVFPRLHRAIIRHPTLVTLTTNMNRPNPSMLLRELADNQTIKLVTWKAPTANTIKLINYHKLFDYVDMHKTVAKCYRYLDPDRPRPNNSNFS
ncbi:hypothetical protein SAMD00019534_048530, partial [Acytostelium subglobosum LB1]|uniref:hypothetical protein n=1 Tax=Acytostelium subglobosum LB1 TaxID=1410327 RepID=UPI000645186F